MCIHTANTPESTLQGAGDWTNRGVDKFSYNVFSTGFSLGDDRIKKLLTSTVVHIIPQVVSYPHGFPEKMGDCDGTNLTAAHLENVFLSDENVSTKMIVNPYNTEIWLYKPWKPKGFFNLKSS